MTLNSRIEKLEQAFGPELNTRSTVAIVIEDEQGRWWQNGEEVSHEALQARTPSLVRVFRLIRTPSVPETPA